MYYASYLTAYDLSSCMPPCPPLSRYYTGRLAAYDEDFVKADEHLSYAFHHCHPSAQSNRRRILRCVAQAGRL